MILVIHGRCRDLKSRYIVAKSLLNAAKDICLGRVAVLSYDYSCIARNGREVIEGTRLLGVFDTKEVDRNQ